MLKIRWHGHSCWEIKNEITLITDPHDGKSIGIPAPNIMGDIILVSHNHYDHNSGVKIVAKVNSKIISDCRKRTIENTEIIGFESYHDETKGDKRGKNIMFKFVLDGIRFCHLGDLGHELDSEIIDKIGEVDILFIPIGGTFTINEKQALNIIKKIKPKIIVPMHYKIGGLSLAINGLDPFLEQSKYKVLHVGNEIDIEKEDLPTETEIWTFTL